MAHDNRKPQTLKTAENGNTIDPHSGIEIRNTDNGLKCGDIDSPQHTRKLTEKEIATQIKRAGDNDGNC